MLHEYKFEIIHEKKRRFFPSCGLKINVYESPQSSPLEKMCSLNYPVIYVFTQPLHHGWGVTRMKIFEN